MKHILSILFSLFLSQVLYAQTTVCDAAIYWKYEGSIKILDKPNGKELTSLQNDVKNENYIGLTIKEIKDDFFLVEIQLQINDTLHYGWIERSEYIGAYMRYENAFMDLTFYTEPNTKSSKPIELKNWKAGFVTIEECGGLWTKVTVTFEGKRITGWIESMKLCANNYSTCG